MDVCSPVFPVESTVVIVHAEELVGGALCVGEEEFLLQDANKRSVAAQITYFIESLFLGLMQGDSRQAVFSEQCPDFKRFPAIAPVTAPAAQSHRKESPCMQPPAPALVHQLCRRYLRWCGDS